MGGVTSRIFRQVNQFNIENRAHRVIANPKPRPAPKYEKNKLQSEKLKQEMPGLETELLKFDKDLDERLRRVYVTSTDVKPQQTVSKKLPPLSHKVRRLQDFGFEEDHHVVEGRILLKDSIKMLMTYAGDDKIAIADLADKYKIKVEDARNIIKYFQCFKLVVPEKMDKEKLEGMVNKFLVGAESGGILSKEEFLKGLGLSRDGKGISAFDETTTKPTVEDTGKRLRLGPKKKFPIEEK